MNNMSCLKRYIVLFYISIVSQVAVAQWKFNVSLSVNGCSGFDKVTENWANAQLKQWNATLIGGFPTKGECENARSIVISSSVTDGKCKVQFTASPCVGSGGAVGNVDVLGVSKGGSFNSTNPVNEINDWSNDDMERMLALNPEYNINSPSIMETGDINYDRARLYERNNFGTPSYSGNNYTGDRYNSNRKAPINFSERNKLEEKFVIQETNDFIRTTKYQELPSMTTESFVEYCNQIMKDVEHIRHLAPEVNYQLYCSETTENGQKVQNVFVEYIIPQNTEVNILEDPFAEQSNKLIDRGDNPLTIDDTNKFKEQSEKNALVEQMKKIQEELDELEKAKKREEYEALFAKRMIDALDLNQMEESYYIARNLHDLGMNQIPFDAAGTAGEVSGKTIGMIVENQFEQEREESGIPKEPENKIADFISEIREIPGLGDLAKNYLGKTVGWFIVNAPELGKSIGHGMAKLNIYFQQREWKNKAELHTENAQMLNREMEIKKNELEKKKKQYSGGEVK